MAEREDSPEAVSGLLCVLTQPQGTQPLMGRWQCPLFWAGIYVGHLPSPSCLSSSSHSWKRLQKASKAHSPRLLGHT